MATKVSSGVAGINVVNPDKMSQAEANAGTSTVKRLIDAKTIWAATAHYRTLSPPEDSSHHWRTSLYTTAMKDSWETPALTLPDQSGSIGLTVQNKLSDGVSEAFYIPVIPNRSVPDGTGMYAPIEANRGSDQILLQMDSFAAATSSISFGFWINPTNIETSNGLNYCVLAQMGGAWNDPSNGSAPATNILGVMSIVDATGFNTGTTPTLTFKFYCGYDSGRRTVTVTGITFHKWVHVWFQATATSLEIYIDGSLSNSISFSSDPLNIVDNGVPLSFMQSIGSSPTTFVGGLGNHIYLWINRVLLASEIETTYNSSQNIVHSSKSIIQDVGDSGNQRYTLIGASQGAQLVSSDLKNLRNYFSDANDSPYAAATQPQSNQIRTSAIVYNGDDPVEAQFRVTSISTNMRVGFTLYFSVTGYSGSDVGLGKFSEGFGLNVNTQQLYHNGTAQGDSKPPLPIGTIITVRITMVYGSCAYVFLIDNVVSFTGSITDFAGWGWNGASFAIGKGKTASATVLGSVDILTNDTDAVYAVGSGFKFAPSI